MIENNSPESFQETRKYLNELVLKYADKSMKRFFSLDAQVYQDGALPSKTKELLGLVASLVLRCDDCIKYHLSQCKDAGVSDAELTETISIGLIVGGSITIPHIRSAIEFWDALK
ncbi:MAG: alkylhydroperoxidase [Candidatus Marinimicrobia bacterium CG08_land_8_20_14_0_20_45_22]|nr:MAG: alkylhydroperoxidase [Candidatus Marinimicrobia bacterium CG08_land_8_20_14_0_20_45_22]